MKLEESLTKIRKIYDEINLSNNWNQEFMTIRNKSLMSHDFSCNEARAPANKLLNRYRDVSPYDHSRVVLSRGDCDYINASLVKVENAGRNYVLTQGPLPQTAGHFWLMVWEQQSKAVLMLNKVIEKNQIKCHQYWPVGSENDDSDTMDFPDVGLRVSLLSETIFNNFIKRVLRVEEVSTGDVREVLQFHYITWPDFGVPTSPRAFLHFLQCVRDSGALEKDVGPAVVHCSAGIGRSGTFCLVDSFLLMMENGQSEEVKELLLEMRKFRMGLIQTADQLKFSYMAILEGLQLIVDGKYPFPCDEPPQNGHSHEDEKPEPPMRIIGGSIDRFAGFEKIISQGIPNRPLPPRPEDSSDSDTESDEDSLQESFSDELEDKEDEDEVEEVPEIRESPQPLSSTEKAENNHHMTNGLEDELLRRRKKTDATMEKLKEMKQKQKESEIRSPKPKRRKESQSSI